MYLIVLVVNDPYQCKKLLKSWNEAGVPGATIIESLGLQKALKGAFRDNLPLMPTENCLGSLKNEDTGFMFVVPVHDIFGHNWD